VHSAYSTSDWIPALAEYWQGGTKETSRPIHSAHPSFPSSNPALLDPIWCIELKKKEMADPASSTVIRPAEVSLSQIVRVAGILCL
jgi:hypothetical protein